MLRVEIKTVRELKTAIRHAKHILVQPRFGASERWIKITKREAKAIASDIPKFATPAAVEMFTGTFGVVEGDALYLG